MSAAAMSSGMIAVVLAAALGLATDPAVAGPTDVNGSLARNPITLQVQTMVTERDHQTGATTPVVRRWAHADRPATQLAATVARSADQPLPPVPDRHQRSATPLIAKGTRGLDGRVVLTGW